MNKRIYSLLVFCLLVNLAFGQFQQGLRMGKYTNLYQMMLNPAATPEGIAVNLLQGGIYVNNNIIGVKGANAFNLLPKKNGLVIEYPRGRVKYPVNGTNGVSDTLLGFFQDTLKNHFAYGSFVVEGPSAVFALNENFSVGLGMRIKGNLGAFNIPDGMIPFTHAAQPFYTTYPIAPFNMSGAVYMEIPLTLSVKKIVGFNVLSLGTALKFILPMMSAYVDSRNALNISQRPSNNFNLANVDGEMAFSVWSRNPINGKIKKSLNGFGMGLDVGGRLAEGEGKWFVGAALTDLGYIRFNKNSTTYNITSTGVSSHSGLAYISSISKGNVIQAGNLLSTDILGSSIAGVSGNEFNLFLPASINFQGGISIGNSFFISTMANIPLLKSNKNIQSMETLMIMPSWESGLWAIKLPFSLTNRQSFTSGFAFRVGPLTIGSDNVSSWVVKSEFTGSDFYFALQLPLFYGNNQTSKGKGGKNSNLFRCYTF
jgi:hypothetical protein